MRENFDNEITKVKNVSLSKSHRLLDDLATAYISSYAGNDHLDKSLLYVKLTRKTLASQGFTLAEIDDYLLERSYISKTLVNKLRTQSIYMNDSTALASHIENRQDKETGKQATDLIIDELKKRPELLKVLKAGKKSGYYDKSNMQKKFKINNTTELKNFYEEHKNIID